MGGSSHLHVSGLIIMAGDVYAHQLEKPFLIFDAKSYVAGLVESWAEDRMDYALEGDREAMRNVAALMDRAEAWQDDSSSPPPYDMQLQLRLTQGPLRVGAAELREYLKGVLAKPYSVPIPPPRMMADGYDLQEDIPEEYIPHFVIVTDQKPHPLFLATRKLRAALRNTGSEIDGQLVETSDLMEQALPHILAARNLTDRLVQPRISPLSESEAKSKSDARKMARSTGKAKHRTRLESEELEPEGIVDAEELAAC